jgi:hypothetical protein
MYKNRKEYVQAVKHLEESLYESARRAKESRPETTQQDD